VTATGGILIRVIRVIRGRIGSAAQGRVVQPMRKEPRRSTLWLRLCRVREEATVVAAPQVSADAAVDPTDARKATARRFGRSDRSAQCRWPRPESTTSIEH
jgi:hypothetical protein